MERFFEKDAFKKTLATLAILSSVVFPGYPLTASALEAEPLAVESDPSIPEIIPRKEWGADESLVTWQAEYAKVEKVVVHHTASSKLVPDSDGSGEYKNMVKAMFLYHTTKKTWTDANGNSYTGFGDIGYNYIIDPEGNIYEGRAGGNGVVGGHAPGFNSGTIGISVIGWYEPGENQTDTDLDDAVEKSLSKLIGWLAANNNIDVNRVSSFSGKNIDGVVGHKDVDQTLCPGRILYDRLDEIQSEAALYAKEYKKNVYQIKGTKTLYIISGGYKTKYAATADLPKAYQSRTAKYISKTQLAAYQFKDANILPDGTLMQVDGAGTVYLLEDGKRRALGMTEAEFAKLGFKSDDIVEIDENDLDYYEEGSLIKYGPDGALISDAGGRVYLIENGKKRAITSVKLFETLKYSWSKVKADAAAGTYLDGDAMYYPDGTLVRAKDAASVYLMQGGKKRTFTSGALFERLGYKWGNILIVDAAEINSYATAANMVYPDGTLVRGAGLPTVYLVDKGQKRQITSATLLGKLGYSFASVVEIPADSLSDYPNGAKASYPDGTLVKVKGGAAVYRVSNGGKEEFTSLSVFNASGAKWSNVIEIEAGEMSLYATTGFVKYPDGTLFKAAGGERIYVMKGGAAVWIKTAEEFVKAGYKWTNVLTLDAAEFKLYVTETVPVVVPTPAPDPTTPTTPATPIDTTPTTPATNANVSAGDYVSGAEPNLRVAITSSTGSNVKLTANGNYKVEYHHAAGDVYLTKQKTGGQVTDVPFFDWDNYIRLIPESRDVIIEIQSYSDLSWDGKINDNKFRGVIELRYSPTAQKLWVIEDVPLEDYLRGISETAGVRTDPEYLKAFAIITRTYAMNYIRLGGKHKTLVNGVNVYEPFHLKNSRNGNGNDQQYKGYNFEMRSAITVTSYEQTEGKVIEYNNKPIVAAYSSDSGGTSKDACVVLTPNYCAAEYDYLRGGVKDPAATVHDAAKIAASHGAGMSATGAYQMALEGSGWEKIITTYYPGVNIDLYY